MSYDPCKQYLLLIVREVLAMHGSMIKSRRRRLGLTQEALADLLDVDQGTISRWERGVERPRPSRVSQLNDILGRGADAFHFRRSIAIVRADVLPSALLDSGLVFAEGSSRTERHYRERGRDMAELVGLPFDGFADMVGMPEVAIYLAEAEYTEGGALLFRFTINNRGRGHTTVAEPLFEDGEFVGSLHYISRYFDFPENDEVTLEHADFVPVSGDAAPIEFMRGPRAGHAL
ncbi:helix-turn-helix domain-containing protein [Roseicyclus sp.]|uniref:helix-turn-helix domain-containing protein n=1 Tax=Roseicyclus sp. TaxID=1914329 RepID=UPI003FA0059F